MAESSEGDAGKVPNLGELQLELFYALFEQIKTNCGHYTSLISLHEARVC